MPLHHQPLKVHFLLGSVFGFKGFLGIREKEKHNA
jgi:hypothetical protein